MVKESGYIFFTTGVTSLIFKRNELFYIAVAGVLLGVDGFSKPYTSRYFVTPLSTVAREATSMKDEYINNAGNDVTQTWLDYVAPLVGALPKIGRL